METGRCNYIDEQGNLCLAISYEDKDGNVITEVILQEQSKVEEMVKYC